MIFKKSVCVVGLSFMFGACSHAPSASVRSTASTNEDLQKIEKALAGFSTDTKYTPAVKFQDQHLIVAEGFNGENDHYTPEDCRQVALAQAALDASLAGRAPFEFSRKLSHRLTVVDDSRDHLGAIVTIRSVAGANNDTNEASYRYILNDPSDGSCAWLSNVDSTEKPKERKDIETEVLTKIFPLISIERRAELDTWFKARFNLITENEKAAQSVGKLIEWECEQASLNNAIKTGVELYQAQFHKSPVILIDFTQSSVAAVFKGPQSGIQAKTLMSLKGYWVLRMTDQSGENTISTKTNFDLQEKPNRCVGTFSSTAVKI